jgi:hypothetical protein
MSSAQWLQAWVANIIKEKNYQNGPGRDYNTAKAWGTQDPYVLQPDFSLKIGDVIVEPDGRLYYEYLLNKGWRVSIATLNGIPVTVVVASKHVYGKVVRVGGNPIKGGFSVRASMGGSLGQGVAYANVEFAAKNIGRVPTNSIIEATYYEPAGFVKKIRHVSIDGRKWTRLDSHYYSPDGSPMSGTEWGAWHTHPLKLPGFSQGELKGQTAVDYYQTRPWTLNAFRSNIVIWLGAGYVGCKTILSRELNNEFRRGYQHDPSLDWLAQQVGVSK